MTSPEPTPRFPLGRPRHRRATLGSGPLFYVHIAASIVGILTLIGTSISVDAVKDAADQLFSSGDDYSGTIWLTGIVTAFVNMVLVEVLGTCFIAPVGPSSEPRGSLIGLLGSERDRR